MQLQELRLPVGTEHPLPYVPFQKSWMLLKDAKQKLSFEAT